MVSDYTCTQIKPGLLQLLLSPQLLATRSILLLQKARPFQGTGELHPSLLLWDVSACTAMHWAGWGCEQIVASTSPQQLWLVSSSMWPDSRFICACPSLKVKDIKVNHTKAWLSGGNSAVLEHCKGTGRIGIISSTWLQGREVQDSCCILHSHWEKQMAGLRPLSSELSEVTHLVWGNV